MKVFFIVVVFVVIVSFVAVVLVLVVVFCSSQKPYYKVLEKFGQYLLLFSLVQGLDQSGTLKCLLTIHHPHQTFERVLCLVGGLYLICKPT